MCRRTSKGDKDNQVFRITWWRYLYRNIAIKILLKYSILDCTWDEVCAWVFVLMLRDRIYILKRRKCVFSQSNNTQSLKWFQDWSTISHIAMFPRRWQCKLSHRFHCHVFRHTGWSTLTEETVTSANRDLHDHNAQPTPESTYKGSIYSQVV